MLKRKQATPPESPAPSKRPTTRSKSPIPVGVNGQPLEVIPGKGEQLSKVPKVTKQKIGQPHPTVAAAVQAEKAVNNPEREGEVLRTAGAETATVQVENISHGQLVVPDTGDASNDTATVSTSSTAPPRAPVAEHSKQQKTQAHIVPTHAGWFSWTSIHTLERRGLPEFFNGKNKMKTPELYMEYRNFVIQKYRENPEKVLAITDIQDLVVGDLNAVRRIIELLDHWGLINYHAPTRPGQCHPAWQGVPAKVEINNAGDLHAVPHSVTPLTSLYQFDNLHTPTKSTFPNSLDPVTALAETVVTESASTPGPSVEYHCNACSADCSKRRYHCQKQADFDLCPDCYSDGKFGPGMSQADFIRMDALSDANSDDGGWTDQETLLLLEALELYGDNWNEIAEHVATKSKAQCILHFVKMPIEDSFLEDVETSGSITAAPPPSTNSKATAAADHSEDNPGTLKAPKPLEQSVETSSKTVNEDGALANKDDSVLKAIMEASGSVEGLSGPEGLIAFADAGNPVMAQVAFLAAMVGPRVAAAAAQSALMALSEDDPASQLAAKATFLLDDPSTTPLPPSLDRLDGASVKEDEVRKGKAGDPKLMEDGHGGTENHKEAKATTEGTSHENGPSAERVRNAAATALAAAAVKAKLLADQEEREIQRLVASVIETQLKKLEMKLKHFSELEVMLKKEYEQIERARQRHFAERARLLASRLGPPPTESSQAAAAAPTQSVAPLTFNSVAAPTGMGNVSTGALVQRPQVFTFGPGPGGVATAMPVSAVRPPLGPFPSGPPVSQ